MALPPTPPFMMLPPSSPLLDEHWIPRSFTDDAFLHDAFTHEVSPPYYSPPSFASEDFGMYNNREHELASYDSVEQTIV